MLALLILIVFAQVDLSGAAIDDNERSVLEAVLRDPELIKRTDFGSFVLSPTTHLASMTYVTVPPFNEMTLDRSQSAFTLSAELVESLRSRNEHSVSLLGIARPKPTRRSGATQVNPRRNVDVSRPGFSDRRTSAVVVIMGTEGDCRTRGGCAHGGYTAYLERNDGGWRVIGHGGHWIE